jgi:hypothetical protein
MHAEPLPVAMRTNLFLENVRLLRFVSGCGTTQKDCDACSFEYPGIVMLVGVGIPLGHSKPLNLILPGMMYGQILLEGDVRAFVSAPCRLRVCRRFLL